MTHVATLKNTVKPLTPIPNDAPIIKITLNDKSGNALKNLYTANPPQNGVFSLDNYNFLNSYMTFCTINTIGQSAGLTPSDFTVQINPSNTSNLNRIYWYLKSIDSNISYVTLTGVFFHDNANSLNVFLSQPTSWDNDTYYAIIQNYPLPFPNGLPPFFISYRVTFNITVDGNVYSFQFDPMIQTRANL